MFNNVGGKIKSLAKVIFWLEVIGTVVAAGIIGYNLRYQVPWCIIAAAGILVGGILVAWLSVLFVYAFGELVENSTIIREHMERRGD